MLPISRSAWRRCEFSSRAKKGCWPEWRKPGPTRCWCAIWRRWHIFRIVTPHTPWIGDFSLNVANELTAELFFDQRAAAAGAELRSELGTIGGDAQRCDAEPVRGGDPPAHADVSHGALRVRGALSDGKDWRDCGRPCDRHQVALRDRVGAEFPLTADTGCRNTVFNSVAQSAAEFVPRMLSLGVRHFRVELLRELGHRRSGPRRTLRASAGRDGNLANTWRQLQVLNQLGVTRGTLQRSGDMRQGSGNKRQDNALGVIIFPSPGVHAWGLALILPCSGPLFDGAAVDRLRKVAIDVRAISLTLASMGPQSFDCGCDTHVQMGDMPDSNL